MHRPFFFALAGATLLFAANARAAIGPKAISMPKWHLLYQQAVAKDLKLTQKQGAELRKLSQAMRAAYNGLRGLPLQQQSQKAAQLQKQYEAKALNLLSSGQSKRLDQIERWIQIQQFTFLHVIQTFPSMKDLKLTQSQRTKINRLVQQEQEMSIRFLQNFRDPNVQAKMKALSKMTEKKVYKEVLTKDQRETLTSLLGKEFKQPKP